MTDATCHPGRPLYAKSQCRQCWRSQRDQHPEQGPRAQCHLERQHYGRGLCAPCYQTWLRAQPHRQATSYERYLKYYSPERHRDSDLRSKFGLTREDYNAMFAAQGGCCAICGTHRPGGRWGSFCVDHNHATGEVRGLLCLRCNRALGLLDDDHAKAQALADYLDPDSKGWKKGR